MGNMNKDLQTHAIVRPEKVEWWWAGGTDLFGGLRSKSLKTFLRKADEILVEQHIRWEHKEITAEEFVTWLPYYQQKMGELGYDLFATPEWYQNKKTEGKKIEALFFYRDEKMIGSAIISRSADTAILHFKASDRIDLASNSNSSLGVVIDFIFQRKMLEEGVLKISSGTSRNAFGVINAYGYLDYKLRIGFDPSAAANAEMLTDVPVNENGEVVFYGVQNEKPAFFRLKPIGSEAPFDATRLQALPIPFVEITY
jgi:hypothetical protein